MLDRGGNRGWITGSHRRNALLVAVLVAITVLYTWKKVELARVARQISSAEIQAGNLEEEQSKLMAAIASRKKPGVIKKIAEDKLGMVYPTGRVTDLILDESDRTEDGVVE